MNKVLIKLDSFEKIKDFITIASSLPYEFNLETEQFTVDGKAIIGLFNLDLSKPIYVNITNSNDYPIEFKNFMIKDK